MKKSKHVKKNPRKKSTPKPQTTALAVVEKPLAPQIVSAVPNVAETIKSLESVRRFVSSCLNTDLNRELGKLRAKGLQGEDAQKAELALRDKYEIDWGTIPGVDKPFLKQPGAEKVMFWLNLRPKYTTQPLELGSGHLEVVCHVTMYHKKTGEEVFEGPDCSCSTMESNFRYRWAESTQHPPQDEADRLKAAGLGRWKRKAVYAYGKFVKHEWIWMVPVENSNIHNERNKVRQIGEKRALVKCVRNMGAMSELFTSDPSEWDIPNENEAESSGPYAEEDFTPSGRLITNQEGVSPSGTRQTARKAQEQKATQAPTPSRRVNQTITITWPPDKACAYLSGDLAEVLPAIQKAVLCQWIESKKAHAIPADQVQELCEMLEKAGYSVIESQQQPVSGASSAAAATAKPEPAETPPETGGAPPERAAPAGHREKTGRIVESKQGITSERKIPYCDFSLGGTWFRCWNKALFEYIVEGKGLDAVAIVDGKNNVVGFRKIGRREFDADFKTPVLQNSEPRPTTTRELFQ
jgi:hypothetical protein